MQLAFTTPRLRVSEVSASTPEIIRNRLSGSLPRLLTPAVVEHLPPHFHAIDSVQKAQNWLRDMLDQSRLFVVSTPDEQTVVGLMFVFSDKQNHAHIGYLLAEEYWGLGLASELLEGFIKFANQDGVWSKLIAGVDTSNLASSKLLLKLGFVKQGTPEQDVVFYHYPLNQ